MKRSLSLLTILLVLCVAKLTAQTAHFEVKNVILAKDSLTGSDNLTFSYTAVYRKGVAGTDTFVGIITTNIITKKNSVPIIGTGPLNVDTIQSPHFLLNGDSTRLYGSFKLTSHYFDNGAGTNNIIVVWPTGGRQNGGVVSSIDSASPKKPIVVSSLAGIDNDVNAFNPVRFFPNPSTSGINLQWNDPAFKVSNIKIIDIFGREVFSSCLKVNNISLSGLKTGIYYLSIEGTDQQKATYSIVIGQ